MHYIAAVVVVQCGDIHGDILSVSIATRHRSAVRTYDPRSICTPGEYKPAQPPTTTHTPVLTMEMVRTTRFPHERRIFLKIRHRYDLSPVSAEREGSSNVSLIVYFGTTSRR